MSRLLNPIEEVIKCTDFDQQHCFSAEFLQRKVGKSVKSGILFPSHCRLRGVNTTKIQSIIKVLCPHMEPVKRQFWLDIPINDNSPDLQIERDPCEVDTEEE